MTRTRPGNRRRWWIAPLIVIVVMGAAAGYVMWAFGKDVNARVDCKNLEKYQSSFGVFNAPHFILGQVLELNKDTKKGGTAVILPPQPTDVTGEQQPVGETSIISEAKFAITSDVKLPSSDKATLDTQVENNTLFVLKNSKRESLTKVESLVNRDAELKNRMRNAPPNRIFLVVSGLLYADGLNFKLKDSGDAKEGGQVLKLGCFNVHVSYECQGSLDVRAKSGALFFKATSLRYNPSSGRIEVDMSEAVDLREYDFSLAAM